MDQIISLGVQALKAYKEQLDAAAEKVEIARALVKKIEVWSKTHILSTIYFIAIMEQYYCFYCNYCSFKINIYLLDTAALKIAILFPITMYVRRLMLIYTKAPSTLILGFRSDDMYDSITW